MQPRSPFEAHAIKAGGLVNTVDDEGHPRFIWPARRMAAAIGSSPEAAATQHFARFAPAYGIQGDPRSGIEVASINRTRRGDYVVGMRQKVDGIELYRGELKVVMRSDLSLLALAGTPSPVAGAKPDARSFQLSPGQALARALEHLYGLSVPEASINSLKAAQPPYVWLDLPSPATVQLSEPARAKKIFVRDGNRLIAAYFIEFFSSRGGTVDSDAYRYLIAADDGRVLERKNLTAHVAYNYRVFADPDAEGRPFDGPVEDFTPHPTGGPDGSVPAFVSPELVSVESFKTEPAGAVDPWLPADAEQSLGNNVDAYADLFAPDGYSNGDLRATTTAPGTFDRVYDTSLEPGASAVQTMASVTNLFYLLNWLHDYFYDSGFTEAAGNAQQDNFGRGGLGSDPIRAEAQDSGGFNNANMSTPADGLPPRVQMYLWSAPSIRTVTVESAGLELVGGRASFGPQQFDLTADVVLADDGTAPNPNDGCEPITNAVAGRIALIDRGLCPSGAKAVQAEAAGAVAVILANDVAGLPPPGLGNTVPPSVINIPAVGVTLEDGNRLKALLGQGVVTARLFGNNTEAGVDGSLDTMIVAHEWGHYLHHRLTDCGTSQCSAMSEGWGDFIALHTILREGDNLDGAYGAAIYGTRANANSGYFGVRRFPYSVDVTKNALTFRNIQDGEPLPDVPIDPNGIPNSEAHNAGEVWTSMLFEAYVALQKNPGARSFSEVRRAFADYIVLGLQLAPIDATFTETRDSILAAITILHPDDLRTVAEAFARRGAGSCAVSPPGNSSDLAPVTESFAIGPAIALTSIEVDDSVDSCDRDGILDAGETGRVQVTVGNTGPAPLVGSTVTLSSTIGGLVFPAGPSAQLNALAPFETQTVTIPIGLDDTVTDLGVLALTVTVASDTACATSVAQVTNHTIQADVVPESATTEDVEAAEPPWGRTGEGAESIWTRVQLAPDNHAWRGDDAGKFTDTQLVTPPLQVSATGDFQITFDHSFSFEVDPVFWDGGVIEVSSDNGATWQDIEAFADPGYNAIITDLAGNPLARREAYGATNASFPDSDTVSLNLGTALAGQTVLIRFRIGTDESVGAPGWTIDNIAFTGIDNAPFTVVVTHAGVCQEPPAADAGPDRTVNSGDDVVLDASGTSDPEGDPLTFLWTQTAGPAVTLFNPTSVRADFTAPQVEQDEVLTFQMQASDGFSSSTDTVDITVRQRSDG